VPPEDESTGLSTGKPGRFDCFTRPLGVFEHSTANPDFRALVTKNENGIRGYGRAAMRIFDFGWQRAVQGWGRDDEGEMRLQMHATDPELLEPRLGTAQVKGLHTNAVDAELVFESVRYY
jgi:hypothetical protein